MVATLLDRRANQVQWRPDGRSKICFGRHASHNGGEDASQGRDIDRIDLDDGISESSELVREIFRVGCYPYNPVRSWQDFLENFPLFSEAAPRRAPSEVKHFKVAVEGDAA